MNTTDEATPRPTPPSGAWFPGLYQFPFWHRIRRHKVVFRRVAYGGLWDGVRYIQVTCFDCGEDWTRTAL